MWWMQSWMKHKRVVTYVQKEENVVCSDNVVCSGGAEVCYTRKREYMGMGL